jgi:phenylacetic acid degradation operon negative regulatory protein
VGVSVASRAVTPTRMGRMVPKPRSLILDLFGEYLRFADARVRLAHLTALLGAFEVSPATVRVTMSRLKREGWFTTERDSRETIYRLSDEMLEVLREGRARIFGPPSGEWNGEWTMVIYQLSEEERQEREQLRKQLAWHGFGSLTTSTWLAAGDRQTVATSLVEGLPPGSADVLTCRTRGAEHDRELTHRCWDLVALAEEYRTFIKQHEHLAEQAASLDGAEALVARTLLISGYRHFPFRDPMLPDDLQPDGWPGVEAHELFRSAHVALGAEARAYVLGIVGRPVDDPETSRVP